MLGGLSDGTINITNSLLSEDCMRTLIAFRELGVDIQINGEKIVIVGKGIQGLTQPKSQIDAGNSGTMARLLSGILSTQSFDSTISLQGLVFHPGVTFALNDLGVKVNKSKNGIWSIV